MHWGSWRVKREGRRFSSATHTPSFIAEMKHQCHWHTQWPTVPWCLLKTIFLPPVKPFLNYRSALEAVYGDWWCYQGQGHQETIPGMVWTSTLYSRQKWAPLAVQADGQCCPSETGWRRDHTHKSGAWKDLKVSRALLALLNQYFAWNHWILVR